MTFGKREERICKLIHAKKELQIPSLLISVQNSQIIKRPSTLGSRIEIDPQWNDSTIPKNSSNELDPRQCEICDVQKLLGMRKMVATFFCRRTHLVSILVSRLEWQSDSRM